MEQIGRDRDNASIYAKIAYDIAARIASGELAEGARFSGRSLMGSSYHVSQETIRRAMKLLSDMDIIDSKQNSGAMVVSRKNAAAYLEKRRMGRDMHALKTELKNLMDQRAALDIRIQKLVSEILDLNDRFEKSNPLRNYEFCLSEGSPLLGRTLRECEFRRHTGALIVALKRRDEVFLPPDPDMALEDGDTLMIAGSPMGALQAEALIKGEAL
ncbi:MAG: TrkA C-terminal domain-containing protein [Candidatus Pelethousia sp.]|nr:TrkA C-terminal domain-containing protein [Candidatus Pelethousia sp.]